MNEGLIHGHIEAEWRLVPVSDVIVRERQRAVDTEHVDRVRKSFRDLGGQLQLQPIVLTGDHVLIDGAHRLEAARAEGWEFVSALIFDGVQEEDRALLEAEANRVRKQLTPVELEDAWRKFYEPAFKTRAKERQAAGGLQGLEARGVITSADSPVIGNTNNWDESSPTSMVKAAKEATGMGLDWLNKITDIREIAQSTTAPEELREAAKRGLEKLSHPHAKVDPVHKSLLKMQELHQQKTEDVSRTRERALNSAIDRTLNETTLLAERLAGKLSEDLHQAAQVVPLGQESLRSIRVALVHSLARVTVVEGRIEDDQRAALSRIGGEVMKLLSQLTIRELGLEADHE